MITDSFLSLRRAARAAERKGAAVITAQQQQRLAALVAHARGASPYFRRLYGTLPEGAVELGALPPVRKPELMARFDEWVTDPAVRLRDLAAFVADPTRLGEDYLGRYTVSTTSGSSGEPAVILHDLGALRVYNVLGYSRALGRFLSFDLFRRLVAGRLHSAAVFATGGHFLSNTMIARRLRTHPIRARYTRLLSALTPLPKLVVELNEFRPVLFSGYPSVLFLLAKEQEAGRLRLRPAFVSLGGETVGPGVKERIAAAFDCPVQDYYGSTEAVGLTFACSQGRLHVNSDWYILEPVNRAGQATPPGESSETVLLTNLANYVQPIIRYVLDDRVMLDTAPCPCGSPFQTIQVEGRTDDTLVFPGQGGEAVAIPPLAISTIVEETAGVRRVQLIQTAPQTLRVRLDLSEPRETVWPVVKERLGAFLRGHQAVGVILEEAAEPPALHPRSGKFRQVFSEVRR